MKKLLFGVNRLSLGVLVLTLPAIATMGQTLAFPGAEGFGRFATGGRGGTVYHVTNLNDSGPGSFRTGATSPNRTIVFDVGGVIRISNLVDVANNVTIAGQTAPGEGITIYGHRMSYSGANNTITRFIRVRMGVNGDGNDTMGIADGHDMIFDHLSVSWGQDETFSVSGSNPTNITIQSTIISQGLQDHSAGGLIQTDGGVSILRSLYIDNHTRNPKVKGTNEYINNVIYNWEVDAYILGDSAGPSCANVIGNYFIDGPGSSAPAFDRGNLNFKLYATNNWQDANLNGVLDGAMLARADYDVSDWQTVPFPYPVTNALPPLTALKLAVSDVGASWHRDIVDERMMTELTSWGTLGETIFTEFEPPMSGPGTVKNGVAPLDTDQDGMPDYWEAALGMSTNAPNNNDASAGGYTKLEDYLNWLADPHGVALTNTPVHVDLRQFTRGFTNSSPAYSVSNAANGTVTLLDGHIARFLPDTNFIGQAGFQWTVVDAQGSTLTRPMNLFFTPLAPAFNPIWRGDGATNNWNTLGDFNWFDGQSLLHPFHAGDNVTFDDTGHASPAVNLIGSLQPASVTVEAEQSYVFAGNGSLDGAMTLNKTGGGTLTLANTNSFTGATTVSNGTLLAHGSLTRSAVTVRSGATLGGNGRLGAAPVLQSGAILAPGNGIGGAGTLTITNALTESGGINNRFDLSNDPTSLVKNDQIIVVGTLSVSGKNFIRVNLLDGPLSNGVYTLIKYGSFAGSLTNFTLVNANGILTNPPGEIAILVNDVRTPGNLTWVGNGVNNAWDNGTTTNWLNAGNPDAFYFFDTVLFDDSGSTNPPVNLVGSLTPASVTVNATKNYAFSGSGSISGYGTLTKSNSGTLTISATNDLAGPTVIAGGVLSVPFLANADLPGPIGAADSSPDNLIFSGGTLRYTGGNGSTDRGATFAAAGGTIEVASGGTVLTLNGLLTGGGSLTKRGPGRLDVNTVNDYSGGTVINEGTVRLANVDGLGVGTVTLNGTSSSAILLFGGDAQTLGNTLNVVGTNNIVKNSGNDTVSDMIGSGTLHLITNSGATFSMAGNMSGFSGTIVADALSNLRFYPSTGSASATFDIGTGNCLLNNRNGGLTVQLGALIGGPNTSIEGASSADSTSTYVIGGKNLDTTFAGRINQRTAARVAAITKIGTGKLTLSGVATNLGATTINGGVLQVDGQITRSAVTVNAGGTLAGSGRLGGPVTVNAGGTLAPGASVGTLTISNNLTLSTGCVLNFELGTTNASDRVVVRTNLVLRGTLNVTNVAGFGAGTYTLLTYGGSLSGTLPTVGSKPVGYSWAVNTNTAGQVRLVAQVQTPPVLGDIKIINDVVELTGSGPANDTCYVLASTNVALPMANWTRVATNQFDGSGSFTFTNSIDSSEPQKFYRLQLP